MKTIKLLPIVLVLVMTFFSACTPGAPLTICHATEDPANPYEAIPVDSDGLKEHREHPNDFGPVPAGGCPTIPMVITDGRITICHATISETNPYREITVSVYGLAGHGPHEGDIFPAPERGCPDGPLDVSDDGNITICHNTGSETNPYDEITISLNALSGHDTHADDIIPAPENGCPTIPLVITEGKITICHRTSSATNPYREITVSVYGLAGHGTHEEDIFPAPEDGCPDSPLDISDEGKITICHNTGSETNPYVEITISLNGLNGHDAHEGDIIPAPESGCPTVQP